MIFGGNIQKMLTFWLFFRCNFSDLEIEMFFARYDRDGNFVFTTDETNRILNDIDNDRVDRPPSVQSNRPLTGREARSARSSRIMSIQSRKNLAVGGITGEEFQV